MNEDLIKIGDYYYLENSASSGSEYRGKLCNASGGAWTEAEVTARYSKNKKIDLSVDYYIDSGWIAPAGSDWAEYGAYNIGSNSYDMFVLDYDKTASELDIYLYSSSEETFPTTPTYSNVPYNPPTETWKIYEEPPAIIYISEIIYDMTTFNTI